MPVCTDQIIAARLYIQDTGIRFMLKPEIPVQCMQAAIPSSGKYPFPFEHQAVELLVLPENIFRSNRPETDISSKALFPSTFFILYDVDPAFAA